MDLAFFGFRSWPFDRRANSLNPFVSTTYDEAFSRLLFLIEEHRRCGLVTGAMGTGKSCLLRQVIGASNRLGRQSIVIDAIAVDGVELAWRVADGLNAGCEEGDSNSRVWTALQSHLTGSAIIGQPIVVAIDQFDLVDFTCGQAVQRLLHLADATGADLTVIVASRERFSSPLILDAVELHVELAGWSEEETSLFIEDALRRAGARERVFSVEAMQAVHSVTKGIPARVVWLCDLALIAALTEESRVVDASIVESAARELTPRPSTIWDRTEAMSLA